MGLFLTILSYCLLGIVPGAIIALATTHREDEPPEREFPIQAYANAALACLLVASMFGTMVGTASTGGEDPDFIQVRRVTDGERWRTFEHTQSYTFPMMLGVLLVYKWREREERLRRKESEKRRTEHEANTYHVAFRLERPVYGHSNVPIADGLDQFEGLDGAAALQKARIERITPIATFDVGASDLREIRVSTHAFSADRQEATFVLDPQSGKFLKQPNSAAT